MLIDSKTILEKAANTYLEKVSEKIPKVSGKTFDSFRQSVNQKRLSIFANKYSPVVEFGRRLGAMPPVSAIRQWLELKGLDVKLAFPIAKSIGNKGTLLHQGKDPRYTGNESGVLKEPLKLITEEIKKEIAKAYISGISLQIKKTLQK